MTWWRWRGPQMLQVPVQVSVPAQVQQLQKLEERPQVVLKSVNASKHTAAEKKTRAIFGVSRQSQTAAPGDESAIVAKQGNTLAKEVDRDVLTSDDADALPVPTEEYLVSQMPQVLSEVRPIYPAEARAKNMEGAVVLSILIDAAGQVRDAQVMSGPEIFRAGALAAMRQFRFRPALVEGKSVAVKIAYTIRFSLNY